MKLWGSAEAPPGMHMAKRPTRTNASAKGSAVAVAKGRRRGGEAKLMSLESYCWIMLVARNATLERCVRGGIIRFHLVDRQTRTAKVR